MMRLSLPVRGFRDGRPHRQRHLVTASLAPSSIALAKGRSACAPRGRRRPVSVGSRSGRQTLDLRRPFAATTGYTTDSSPSRPTTGPACSSVGGRFASWSPPRHARESVAVPGARCGRSERFADERDSAAMRWPCSPRATRCSGVTSPSRTSRHLGARWRAAREAPSP